MVDQSLIKTRLYFNFITCDSLCNIVASAVHILIFSFWRYSLISNDCICNNATTELSDIPLQFISRSSAKFQLVIASFYKTITNHAFSIKLSKNSSETSPKRQFSTIVLSLFRYSWPITIRP